MSAAGLLTEIAQNFEENIRLQIIYNKFWLLNCIIEQVTNGTLKHSHFTFPKNTKWYSTVYVPTFTHETNKNKTEHTEIEKGISIIIGDLQISKERWKISEINQNCSCLYFVKGYIFNKNTLYETADNPIYWADDITYLMKMVNKGIEEEKISEFPEKIGFYELRPANVHFKFIEKETLKEALIKKFNSPFYNRPEKYQFIKKKELDWLKNNFETFIEKLDIKLITWEELMESVENPKTKMELNEFYKKCVELEYIG